MPTHAMVLAAGLGLRLRPITDTLPKPLVEVGGRALLDRALDALQTAGVPRVVVNTHHLAPKIRSHLAGRKMPQIVLSHEDTLLETGGGVRLALPLLGAGPFCVINSDTFWLDGATPMLARLAAQWDPARMDALLLLHPVVSAVGWDGDSRGDYFMASDGAARRRKDSEIAPFLFAGVTLCGPALFEGAPDGAFSLRVLWDRAEEHGRLFGMRHDGEWFHVGSPQALTQAEDWFARGGRRRRTME